MNRQTAPRQWRYSTCGSATRTTCDNLDCRYCDIHGTAVRGSGLRHISVYEVVCREELQGADRTADTHRRHRYRHTLGTDNDRRCGNVRAGRHDELRRHRPFRYVDSLGRADERPYPGRACASGATRHTSRAGGSPVQLRRSCDLHRRTVPHGRARRGVGAVAHNAAGSRRGEWARDILRPRDRPAVEAVADMSVDAERRAGRYGDVGRCVDDRQRPCTGRGGGCRTTISAATIRSRVRSTASIWPIRTNT